MKDQTTRMKQVVLAIAVTFLLMTTGGPALSLTIYNDQGTKIDLYNRLYLYYENTDAGRMTGGSSRIGVRASTEVNEDLSVFARAEFRYDASERERQAVFNDRRNTYVGLKTGLGQMVVGNFDSVYYKVVSHQFDIYQNDSSYVALGAGSTASRANSIAYSSPKMNGFQLHGQVRHYEESATASGDEELMFQVSGSFKMNDFTLGAGAVIDNENAGRDETLIGLSAAYNIMDELSARLMLENQKDAGENDYHIALGVVYKYGKGNVYATVGQVPDEETYSAFGATYHFSKPMRAFVEYGNGDSINEDGVLSAGFRYDF